MEWKTENQYNAFNSYKGISYYEHYRKFLAWLDGKSELPPPIECNLDPIAECNLRCYFCITQRYLRNQREEVGQMRKLSLDYIFRLIDFLKSWGVRGLCISGGGEPSLHEGLPDIINYGVKSGLDICVVTNAVHLTDDLAQSLQQCRWVALSVDAAIDKTYTYVKGRDAFDTVIMNIYNLAKLRHEQQSKVDLCYKFLLLPENQGEIFEACKLAKSIGVQDFHCRPVDFERSDIKDAHQLEYDRELIERQFAQCHEIETPNFHVYTVTHKFDKDFHVQHKFARCLASPLILPVLTDGNAYLCVEHKMDAKYRLGSCFPNPESILDWWGKDAHREMVKSIIPKLHCSRCIYSEYHRQIEALEQDTMCLNFP